jgi:death-on-curing protein
MKEVDTVYLSVEEILNLYFNLVKTFKDTDTPIGFPCVHNYILLKSAVERPKTTIQKKEVYKSIYMKAAVLAESIIGFHVFVDGNKRIGMFAASTFMEINGKILELTDEEYYDVAMKIATKKIQLPQIATIFSQKSRDFDEWMEARLDGIEAYKGSKEEKKYIRKARGIKNWKAPR